MLSSGLLGCRASLTTGDEDNSIAEDGRVTTVTALNPDLSAAKTTGFVFTGGGTLVFLV